MSIIAAGTTTTTALSSTGNTDGTLQLQVNGTTPSVTLNTLGAIGVGSTPNYGTSGQALVSAGSTAAPTWANVTTSPAGSTGQVQYNNAGAFGAISSGTTGQVLTSSGSGAAPTWSTVSAVPTFTASGSIASAGLAVSLNSDGTVSTTTGTTVSFTAASGATTPNTRTSNGYSCSGYDPVNNVVVLVTTYSTNIMAYVGTVSGSTISFGTEQTVVSGLNSTFLSMAFDTTNNKFIIAYAVTNNNTVRAKTLTVSGTSLTLGAEVTLTSSSTFVDNVSIAFSQIATKFIISAYSATNQLTGLWLCSISGTSITQDAYNQNAISTFLGNAIACNPTTGLFAVGGRSISTGYAYLRPVTVSGSTFTVGSPIDVHTTSTADYTTPCFVGTATSGYSLAVAYVPSGTGGSLYIKAGYEQSNSFVLGGATSLGSSFSFSRTINVVSNPAGSNVSITWSDGNSNYATSANAVISKNGVAVAGAVNQLFTTVDSGAVSSCVYSAVSSNLVWYGVNGSTGKATYVVFTPTGYSSNAMSFIGFSTGSASSGASVGVSMLANMNTNQSGLTLGSKYYLTYAGGLATTNTGFPYAGTSYGATKIFVGV